MQTLNRRLKATCVDRCPWRCSDVASRKRESRLIFTSGECRKCRLTIRKQLMELLGHAFHCCCQEVDDRVGVLLTVVVQGE
jgi:hypothetical protein